MSSPSEEPNQTSKTFERESERESTREREDMTTWEWKEAERGCRDYGTLESEQGPKKTKGKTRSDRVSKKKIARERQGKTEGKGPWRLIEVSLDFGKCSHADGVNKYWTGISHHLQRERGGGVIGKEKNREGKQKNDPMQKKSVHTSKSKLLIIWAAKSTLNE